MDRLSADALLRGLHPSPSSPAIALEGMDANDQRAAFAYLLLCEDELNLRREGWISDETWHFWRNGIESQLKKYPVAQAWAYMCDQDSDDAPFTMLRTLMKEPGTYDPLPGMWLARYWKGLRPQIGRTHGQRDVKAHTPRSNHVVTRPPARDDREQIMIQ